MRPTIDHRCHCYPLLSLFSFSVNFKRPAQTKKQPEEGGEQFFLRTDKTTPAELVLYVPVFTKEPVGWICFSYDSRTCAAAQ